MVAVVGLIVAVKVYGVFVIPLAGPVRVTSVCGAAGSLMTMVWVSTAVPCKFRAVTVMVFVPGADQVWPGTVKARVLSILDHGLAWSV